MVRIPPSVHVYLWFLDTWLYLQGVFIRRIIKAAVQGVSKAQRGLGGHPPACSRWVPAQTDFQRAIVDVGIEGVAPIAPEVHCSTAAGRSSACLLHQRPLLGAFWCFILRQSL